MLTLTLLVGAPASGKSTYAKTLQDDNTVILSSDSIRQELWGDENDQQNPEIVFSTLYARAKDALNNKQNVVIDATNYTRADRSKALFPLREFDIHRRAVVFLTPIDTCIARDNLRSRKVGPSVIKSFFYRYEQPTIDEGFDEILYIDSNT